MVKAAETMAAPNSNRTTWLWLAAGAWVLLFASFPAGFLAGCAMASGQDAAGRGLGFGLGFLGVGIMVGVASAILASIFTLRWLSGAAGKWLAILPWVILVAVWTFLFCTRAAQNLINGLGGSW